MDPVNRAPAYAEPGPATRIRQYRPQVNGLYAEGLSPVKMGRRVIPEALESEERASGLGRALT